MNKFIVIPSLVILGIAVLSKSAILADDSQNQVNVSDDTNRSVISVSYSAGKFDLDDRSGVPPGRSSGSR